MKSHAQIYTDWLDSLIESSLFSVKEIKLNESSHWRLDNGAIKHSSDKFFKIIGLTYKDINGIENEQPFIDQREIGTLGFLMRVYQGKNQLLVQAKIEPGNIGVAQLAPTFQATYSNANGFHGGTIPLYLELFKQKNEYIIFDVLNSEQGTRFYHKLNRNVLALADSEIKLSEYHKWFNIEDLLDMVKVDYLINTDARSVLVSSPWHILVGREPFSRYKDAFSLELKKSYNFSSEIVNIKEIKVRIKNLRNTVDIAKVIGLESLKKWELNDTGIVPNNNSFRVKQIKVNAFGREVSFWDQPIVDSFSDGKVFLLCGRFNNILYFKFKLSFEPGLINKVELTPEIVYEPGYKNNEVYKCPQGKIVSEVKQSEEGGRFYQDNNLFRLIDVDQIPSSNLKDEYWLTLKDIRVLLDEGGWFTNEARSVLSLLLPYL